MAARVTKRNRIGVLSTTDDRLPDTLRAYSKYQGIEIVSIAPDATEIPDDLACIGIQSPNFFGQIEDVERLTDLAHANGALSIVHVNPTALGMFRAREKYSRHKVETMTNIMTRISGTIRMLNLKPPTTKNKYRNTIAQKKNAKTQHVNVKVFSVACA